MRLNGALGIDLPPPFDNVDIWAPRVDEVGGFPRALITGGIGYLTAVARVPDVRVERVQSEVDAIAQAYARANPTNTDADPDASLRLTPIRERVVSNVRAPLLMLMGAVGLVLLIGCANVANLLLVRATARSHEAAVRLALGASRWDLVRWMTAEGLLYVTADQPMTAIGERPVGQWSAITPDYFTTLGIPIVEGRAIAASDTEQSPLVVVISQGLAHRGWPGRSPIGKRLLVGRFPGFAEVVGVAGDVKNNGLARDPLPEMYTPYPQRPWPAVELAVRAIRGDPLALANAVRAAVQEVDRELPITHVETMETVLAGSISTERLMTTLLVVFAAVALVMAAVGLYGVIAYTVAQRTQEIGVRIAWGARPGAVLRLVAAEGLRLAASA